MNRIIVSSLAMRKMLSGMTAVHMLDELTTITVENKKLTIRGKILYVEGSADFSIQVRLRKVYNLYRLMAALEDQPVTLALDNESIEISGLIM